MLVALIFIILPVSGQQPATTRYIYDNNGRLKAVILPTGEATVYEYDLAGNLTAIRRNPTTLVEIFSFTPQGGVPGDTVTFIGTGFGAGVTSVSFNGTTGTVIQSSPTVVVAEVPQGVTTGPVTITTPNGAATTSTPFTLVGVKVLPPSIAILFGETFQFSATVTFIGNQSLTWSVDGITGGNSTVGTITQNGLYTAPSQTKSVTIRATSVAIPTQFGEALVSVRDSTTVQYALSAGVSVRYGSVESLPVVAANALSVHYGNTVDHQSAMSNGVSVTTGPVINSISPVNVPRGTSTSITIAGSNLTGTNDLKFIRTDGSVDTAITVSNINVNTEGTQLTATLTLTAGATLGQRVVVALTPTLRTLTLSTGSNLIQVVTP